MGVANLFSKINAKATILGTLSLLVVALVLHIVPPVGIILSLFATIPGIVLWHKSKASFGLAAVISVVVTVLLGNIFVLSTMIILLLLSLVIGQLLLEHTSKERILYISTTIAGIAAVIVMMVLQAAKMMPSSESIIRPLKNRMQEAVTVTGMGDNYQNMLEESFRQMSVQLPSLVIIGIFLFVLISLIVTFPIVRKFKVATPLFKPLYLWRMPRVLLVLYVIVLLLVLFAVEPSTFQSILLNFENILSLCMFLQGLSLIHYFGKAKSLPFAVTVAILVVGIIINPVTHLVALLGVIDLALNLKSSIKK
ncbi:DUF2232 domain-containing protein [Staphylococcus auricularis]|uniref:DUF2232 domain-containing protein n=1 Tax=Staphylococcus auricularis TaxID=29379 RepID=A0AAW7MCU2_9STAP|nr:DUF2232 domain-containing protein [Staphylococcus auricularis]MDC6327157.1 DUF2232 domain-containing protein [Staphylococcus auricularis]MDN4533133.1 DUF2232 domain-containing protein [Staphylococcus auricularis]MDN4533365.1 DUF2232 domain-containing protein [Staphylococcus auricularis]